MRVALVTGAGGGIGAAIVTALRADGVEVVATDISDGADLVADVSTFAGAQDAVAAAVDEYGHLDVLVNNAGGGVLRRFLDHDEDSIAETLSRNLLTTIHCCRAALPALIESGSGRIVSIGGESVRNGLALHAMYNAAKGGVHGLTSGLAREFAPHGVTVNCVAPSIVATPAVDRFLATREELVPGWNDMLDQALADIPSGRPATIQEVADTVVFLASERASFITGQVISVNGGSSMQ